MPLKSSREKSNLKKAKKENTCPICNSNIFFTVFVYRKPPALEVRFKSYSNNKYYRRVLCCKLCGHFISVHNLGNYNLYKNDYVNSNYKDKGGIKKTFERIISLEPSKSDNFGRTERVNQFASSYLIRPRKEHRLPSILDVGSGLCVFLYKMKQFGWRCAAVDPDLRSVNHARNTVGINAVCCDFMKMKGEKSFDVLTFNKVIEHVSNPISMLSKSTIFLNDGGFVYVEVPDGEQAIIEGKNREEFTIDHPHIFSFASFVLLVKKSGYVPLRVERLREPSGKYSLIAFLKKVS